MKKIFNKKVITGLLAAFFIVAGLFLVWFSTLNIPGIDNFEKRIISNSTKIYDRTGEVVLYDIHENIQRTTVNPDEISQYAKDAAVAIEDHSFYQHDGVVWKSTTRAVISTILYKLGFGGNGTQGGSTITQQVIKNTILTNDKTITRKVKEWILSYKLERKISKDDILGIYLNESPYGGVLYGIKEAARAFFGKSPKDLTLAEAAYLAAIPNRPTYYSPYGNHVEKLEERRNLVLALMLKYGFIDEAKYDLAIEEKVEFLPQSDNNAKALHFVQYIREYLEEEYGQDAVENGGLQVVTTLDYELQAEAEEIILRYALQNEETYNASNSGAVALDPKTGQILAMVGSRNYFDEEIDGNYNVTLAERQPGSAFKPVVYSAAFEIGYLPESILFDTRAQFSTRCEPNDYSDELPCYAPRNYDNEFKGPVPIRSALAESRNVPAVKMVYLVGVGRAIEQAKKLGITTLDLSPEHYGLSLVLGGGEVSLLELTSAYTVFAENGVRHNPVGILEIRDKDGNLLEELQPKEEQVLDPNAARMVSDILSDNVARTPLFGPNSFLYFGDRDMAGKTGTTNDNRDAWLVGYTPNIAVGVWVGNNDNSPMLRGSAMAGGPWREIMDKALQELPVESFKPYDLPSNYDELPPILRGVWVGNKSFYVDSVTGKLATEFTPEETRVEIPYIEPHDVLHWINKKDPQDPNGNSRNDPQYEAWEFGVQKWLDEKYPILKSLSIDVPNEYDDVHGADSKIGFSVNLNQEGSYSENDVVEISLSKISSDGSIGRADFYVNGALIGADDRSPFRFSFVPNEVPEIEMGENTLTIVLLDELFNKGEKDVSFEIR